MTLEREVLSLDIDPEIKDNILAKLKREYISCDEYEAAMAQTKEEFYKLSTRGEKTNIALVEACVSLGKVIEIQLKGRY